MEKLPDYNKSIFNYENTYGYKLNINHPQIKSLYYRYKKSKNLPEHFPLSDEQRREFEAEILKRIKARDKTGAHKVGR